MQQSKRIAIIGNAGSGKSVLALKLHTLLKLPLYHLDQYYWKPGWERRDAEEYRKMHDDLCDKEEWIIDGVNRKVLAYRFEKADTIIFLDLPRYVCIWRIFKRTFQYFGKETPTGAHGCAERFDARIL